MPCDWYSLVLTKETLGHLGFDAFGLKLHCKVPYFIMISELNAVYNIPPMVKLARRESPERPLKEMSQYWPFIT